MKIIFFFSFFLNLLLNCADGIYKSVELRILIKEDASRINLKVDGKLYIVEENTNEKYELVDDSEYDILAVDDKNISVNGEKLNSPFWLSVSNPHSSVEIDGIKYRGKFRFYTNKGKINVVEYVDIERYLWGVLAPEMGVNWPYEALKAQAVAARTYAIYSIKKGADYDLTSTTKHQVYTGFEKVSPQIIAAVNETIGEVLTYQGRIFPAYYHANSGGYTTNPSAVWNGEKITPLKGVKDPYSKYSSNYRWTLFVLNSDIVSFLNRKGYYVSSVKNLKVYSRDKSGRAVRFSISTDKGNYRVDAKELRDYLGMFNMKSTLITSVEKTKSGFKIYGRGWGHGIGLSQDGAKRMADLGFKYRKILEFYYPGSKIMDIDKVYESY